MERPHKGLLNQVFRLVTIPYDFQDNLENRPLVTVQEGLIGGLVAGKCLADQQFVRFLHQFNLTLRYAFSNIVFQAGRKDSREHGQNQKVLWPPPLLRRARSRNGLKRRRFCDQRALSLKPLLLACDTLDATFPQSMGDNPILLLIGIPATTPRPRRNSLLHSTSELAAFQFGTSTVTALILHKKPSGRDGTKD